MLKKIGLLGLIAAAAMTMFVTSSSASDGGSTAGCRLERVTLTTAGKFSQNSGGNPDDLVLYLETNDAGNEAIRLIPGWTEGFMRLMERADCAKNSDRYEADVTRK